MAVGPGGSPAASEDVGANNKITFRIDGFTRSDDDIPPTRIIFVIMACCMGIAAEGVAYEDGIVALFIQMAICF